MADAIWVITESDDDRTYVVTVHASDDIAFGLDETTGVAYARHVLAVAARAEYDAAVFRQLTSVKQITAEVAAMTVADLRAARPALPETGTPLEFKPYVSAKTGLPGVFVHLNGEGFSQWTVDEAKSHAVYVLECLAGAPLDTEYRTFLADVLRVGDERALVMVDDLRNHREVA